MIVFLNGASSSGKTSLSRALQARWPGPLLYWSLDTVIAQLPFAYTGKGAHAQEGFEVAGSRVRAGLHGQALNALSAQYLATLAAAGYDIVVDYVLLEQAMLAPFTDALRDCDVCLVGLYCEEALLAERNAARPDRAPGLALAQQQVVHFARDRYDLILDSSLSSVDQLAEQLMTYIADNPPARGLEFAAG